MSDRENNNTGMVCIWDRISEYRAKQGPERVDRTCW